MTLPAPNLDDRRAQDIVDEAKQRIASLVPGWTDHNVSDPGVALIELFAWMTEMTLYRLNQVPDRLYVKFLELVGIELFSAVPSRGELLFRLNGARDTTVRIPAGTPVSTARSGDEEPVVFCTEDELAIVPPELVACLAPDGAELRDHWDELRREASSVVLFESLLPGDAFYLGFAQALSRNLLKLDMVMGPEGAGVDPSRPPRAWEFWNGRTWAPARVVLDSTEGFNQTGTVEVLLGSEHQQLPLGQARAFWVRCILTEPEEGQPAYANPPVLEGLVATCVGGAVPALHAEPSPRELLGYSTGEPGQTFVVRRRPVLPRRYGETVRVLDGEDDESTAPETSSATEWGEVDQRDWMEVAEFSDAREDDRVFVWSGATGEIRFGPCVVDSAGQRVQHGAVPPRDAPIVCTGYRYGGGTRGNVGPGRLTVMQTAIPLVDSVTNPEATTGGVDPETIENARMRGPLTLRAGARAVTAEDFERAALDAAREVARAQCLPPADPGGAARLLIVPHVDKAATDLDIDDLQVQPELERKIKAHLEPRRILTVRVAIQAPTYQPVRVEAWVQAAPGVRAELLRAVAEERLYEFINPLTGGPSGQGWPFDYDLTVLNVQAVLAGLPGLQQVRALRFLTVDPRRGGDPVQMDPLVPLTQGTLFVSGQHHVEVEL